MSNATGCLVLGAALIVSISVLANDSEQMRQGAEVYKEYCAKCHGDNGRGGSGYANPIWGDGAQIRKFKHAQALIEYNKLLMPFDNPAALTDEQKLAVTAFMLSNHGVLGRGDTLHASNAASLAISK